MSSNKPVETESRDRIDDHRKEMEGKFRWAIGTAILVLITVFGVLWNRIGALEDKISNLGEKLSAVDTRVTKIETKVNEHWR